ncbi:uracil-DNA glycosylase [Candidatus Roizmanbacteria bacterium]|nr:uracil-DNA glycosylase [Candidatus Roizmanbacteria bacterium]
MSGKELAEITKEILSCRICRKNSVGTAVPGEGSPRAKVMFVGEAPGRQEAVSGRPFIGRSGRLLRTAIKKIGLAETEVYITSPVKYLKNYVTPKPADIVHGRVHLEQQIAAINPAVLVLLGNVAVTGTLGKKIAIMKVHGKYERKNGRIYFFTLHPAAALRFQKFKAVMDTDWLVLRKLLREKKIV